MNNGVFNGGHKPSKFSFSKASQNSVSGMASSENRGFMVISPILRHLI